MGMFTLDLRRIFGKLYGDLLVGGGGGRGGDIQPFFLKQKLRHFHHIFSLTL
jgi:hypothetical protein